MYNFITWLRGWFQVGMVGVLAVAVALLVASAAPTAHADDGGQAPETEVVNESGVGPRIEVVTTDRQAPSAEDVDKGAATDDTGAAEVDGAINGGALQSLLDPRYATASEPAAHTPGLRNRLAPSSTACSASWIVINSGRGAEAPTWALGHRHSTGNHYVRYYWKVGSYAYVWEWWADNNGGWDGDTRDTPYGRILCSYPPR